jgi:hypothetical protein
MTSGVRFSIWFNQAHIPFGGPAQVLVGTLLGLLQILPPSTRLLLNEPGDFNWIFDGSADFLRYAEAATRGLKRAVGPAVFSASDAVADPASSPIWAFGERQFTAFLIQSEWWGRWISRGLPFHDLGHHRPLVVWGAGVDTEFFRPKTEVATASQPPANDFFIYFKSQDWQTLGRIHEYLQTRHFGLRGSTLIYYFHNHETLRAAARGAKFCIYVGSTETQGLAALEIMATGCPLFVLDATEFRDTGTGLSMTGATSVTCWDPPRCGVKSNLPMLPEDFPRFLAALPTYRPREFVCDAYSWSAAAAKLLRILEVVGCEVS